MKFGDFFNSEIITEYKIHYFDYIYLKQISNRNILNDKDNINKLLNNINEKINIELQKVNEFYKQRSDEINNLINNLSHNNIQNIFEECDKLRHFILLNSICIVKFIKRINKRTSYFSMDKIDAKELLNNTEFYNCILLNKIYTTLTNKIKEKKIKYANYLLNNSYSLSILKNINSTNHFSDYQLLPKYNYNMNNEENFTDYLTHKLGPNNAFISLEISNNISINQIGENSSKMTLPMRLLYTFSVLTFIYFFIFGLDLMSNSFKALSGQGVGTLFEYISNPIAGVMMGIIITVLLQSSSTTTSVIVSMVGSSIIDVSTAIPLIMGANIGTSITNTLISYAHVKNINEFKLAFTGATVHDIFNLLTVLILLPIEVISRSLGYPLLFNISKGITYLLMGINDAQTFVSPIKIIVKPLSSLFLSIDKNVIKASAMGCLSCNETSTNETSTNLYCWDVKRKFCLTKEEWDDKYSHTIKGGFLKDLGDIGGGSLGLFISLVTLCITLYGIVKILHKLVMANQGRGRILNMVKKSLNISSYLTMLLGMLLTISVQSSSIITSTFTPLVGLSIITVEQMFPLTLGANIGTTCTAILASLVTESTNAIQISMCHFIFNIIGILIWFPIPKVRKLPLKMAYKLGDLIYLYKWFGIFYILYTFIVFPIMCWGISFMMPMSIVNLVFGVLLILGLIGGSGGMFYKFDTIINKIKNN